MKNLRKIYPISLILQNRMETGFAVKTKNFTGTRLNQDDEWDTRQRKWLPFQRYTLQNGQEDHQNRQQIKCKISVVVGPTNTEEDKSSTDSDVAEESFPLKRKYQRTKSAAKLVSKVSLSTRKASTVLENLAEEGLDVRTPPQSGIWRRVIKDADKVKARRKNLINEEEFCLNFDGKRIDSKEYQVVCLRNSARPLNLDVLACDSGSAENIFIPLQDLLDEYNAWRRVKMIVSDNTAENTIHRNGVVARLQKQFQKKGYSGASVYWLSTQHSRPNSSAVPGFLLPNRITVT